MVGNRQARNEKGRPLHRADQKNRAGGFSGEGNVAAGPAARGFPRGQGIEGAHRGGRGSDQDRLGFDGQGGGGRRNHRRAERGHRVAPAHAAGGRARGGFCPRRIARGRGLAPAADEITAAQIWAQDGIKFGPMLEQIPAAKHHRALESFKAGESRPLAGNVARLVERRLRQAVPRNWPACSSREAKWNCSRRRSRGSSASTPPAANCCSGSAATATTPSRTSSARKFSAPCSPRWSATSSTKNARTVCAISFWTTRNCSAN